MIWYDTICRRYLNNYIKQYWQFLIDLARARGVSPSFASPGVSVALNTSLSASQDLKERKTASSDYGRFFKEAPRMNGGLNKSMNGNAEI